MRNKVLFSSLLVSFMTIAFAKDGSSKGGRRSSEIMEVVKNEAKDLKNIYLKRLEVLPDLEGTIYSKFAIDEFGNVIFYKIDDKTLNDSILEIEVEREVRSWKFKKINKPGDVTEVIYPFVFKIPKNQ